MLPNLQANENRTGCLHGDRIGALQGSYLEDKKIDHKSSINIIAVPLPVISG